jgi:hypothetical protein
MIEEQLIDDVVNGVLEQGHLTKNQILETWGVAEGDYKELQKRVLKKDKSLEKGSKHSGGFVVRKRKGAFPDEDAGDQLLLRTRWEQEAV